MEERTLQEVFAKMNTRDEMIAWVGENHGVEPHVARLIVEAEFGEARINGTPSTEELRAHPELYFEEGKLPKYLSD